MYFRMKFYEITLELGSEKDRRECAYNDACPTLSVR